MMSDLNIKFRQRMTEVHTQHENRKRNVDEGLKFFFPEIRERLWRNMHMNVSRISCNATF